MRLAAQLAETVAELRVVLTAPTVCLVTGRLARALDNDDGGGGRLEAAAAAASCCRMTASAAAARPFAVAGTGTGSGSGWFPKKSRGSGADPVDANPNLELASLPVGEPGDMLLPMLKPDWSLPAGGAAGFPGVELVPNWAGSTVLTIL